MSDFPSTIICQSGVATGSISTGSPACFASEGYRTMTSTVNGTAAWPAANLAIYLPFAVDQTVTAMQTCWYNGTVSATNAIDTGIFTEAGVCIVSSGSATQSGAGLQVANITDTVLTPGVYYMAMSVLGVTSGTFGRGNQLTGLLLESYGVQQQATAFPLPVAGASATFANPTNSYIPQFGVLFTATA